MYECDVYVKCDYMNVKLWQLKHFVASFNLTANIITNQNEVSQIEMRKVPLGYPEQKLRALRCCHADHYRYNLRRKLSEQKSGILFLKTKKIVMEQSMEANVIVVCQIYVFTHYLYINSNLSDKTRSAAHAF